MKLPLLPSAIVAILLAASIAQGGATWAVSASQARASGYGTLPTMQFGSAVAGVGDVNGDGYDDVLVGADPGAYNGLPSPFSALTDAPGSAFLFLGPILGEMSPLTATTRFALGLPADSTGTSVAGVGDVNGDGYADFAIGSSNRGGQAGPSIVYVFFGGERFGANGGTPLPVVSVALADVMITLGVEFFASTPTGAVNDFGHAIAGAGDVNGDGYDDILLGTPTSLLLVDSPAYLVLGGPHLPRALTTDLAIRFDFPDQSIVRVAGLPDVNGDGRDELLFGGWPAGSPAKAFLILGRPTFPTHELVTQADLTIEASSTYALHGGTVASAGDVNHDGRADIVVTAPMANRAYVFHTPGQLPAQRTTNDADVTFHFSASGPNIVAPLGDLDGDGWPDLAFAAISSRVIVARGPFNASTTLPDASSTDVASSTWLDWFGASMANAGDTDGDGKADLLVGAPYASPRPLPSYGALVNREGEAFLFGGDQLLGSV